MGKGPEAPDPYATAQAQSQFNQQTAQSQQIMNMVNQSTPWGNVSYDQTGDINGTPTFTATTTLSPEQQAIFGKTQEAQNNIAQSAANLSGNVSDNLSNPFSFTNDDASQWAYDLASPRILQQQGQDTAALRNQLINSGLRPGTAAYDREMTRNTQGDRDQLNQLALQGRGQAFNEALTTRNQPLNELSALLSQSQVTNPNSTVAAAPQTSVAGVDYSGLVQQNYQNQLQQSSAGLGGLFGLAGTLGSALIRK